MSQTIIIVGRFPPPVDGQTMVTDHLAGLLEEEFEVERISLSAPPEPYLRSDSTFSVDKIAHYLRWARTMRKRLAQHPDTPVLWANISPKPLGHWRDILTVLPAFRPQQRVYAVSHWGNFDVIFSSKLTKWTTPLLIRRLSGLVLHSEALSEKCSAVPAHKRFVIRNTVGPEMLCSPQEIAQKQASRAERRRLRLLYLSNMIASKGYFDVLEAVRLLLERGVDVEARFAGRWQSDEEERQFADYVSTHNLNDRVFHLGAVKERAGIKALHLQADVFLLPTYYPTEAQPLAIIEAIAAATPVVTTRHASIPEMVFDEQQALFALARDPAGLADQVERLADANFWQQLSDGARARFEEVFSPTAVRRKWLEILELS